jgi:hypothetical protein
MTALNFYIHKINFNTFIPKVYKANITESLSTTTQVSLVQLSLYLECECELLSQQ